MGHKMKKQRQDPWSQAEAEAELVVRGRGVVASAKYTQPRTDAELIHRPKEVLVRLGIGSQFPSVPFLALLIAFF